MSRNEKSSETMSVQANKVLEIVAASSFLVLIFRRLEALGVITPSA